MRYNQSQHVKMCGYLTTVVTTSYYLGGTLGAQREDTTLRYAHQDHLSGTSLMTDTGGNSLGTMKYYPYGNTRSGSVPTDELFTGQKLDGTGLYYYGARYYDPVIGRFISPDPQVQSNSGSIAIAEALNVYTESNGLKNDLSNSSEANRESNCIENPQCLNRFSYVTNNPLKFNDPTGLNTIAIGLYISAGACGDVEGNVLLVVDDKGNWGYMTTPAGGWMVGITLSGGVSYQWTNADTIYDLEGVSSQTGGSVTLSGISGGVELVVGDGYSGFNVNVGASVGTPAEYHVAVGTTGVDVQGNALWARIMYHVLTGGIELFIDAFQDGAMTEIEMPIE